jgi:hypothetical protein
MAVPQTTPILIPAMHSFEDVRQVLSQALQTMQTQLLAALPVTDYGGQRISHVGAPQEMADVVNVAYLKSTLLPLINNKG